MTERTVSVIVVSRGRPDGLLRCLTGIGQLDYEAFEVVVVADAPGMAAVRACGMGQRVKTVAFDQANISAARNLGLEQAAGDIVAFIDDDAVPEPSWLRHLIAPFVDSQVAAAGGYARGRNGISFQSTAQSVDACGYHSALDMGGDNARIFDGSKGRAIKTEGTNCAFRRDVLMDMGGFDPAFAFYLDETDVNLRMAEAGAKTAIVPLAQVHHGFAASEQRHASRMPRSLFDIGASLVVLLRKHAPRAEHGRVQDAMRVEQKARLLRHMVAGNCEPRDIGPLMASLEAGFTDGQGRNIGQTAALRHSGKGFHPLVRDDKRFASVHIAGRVRQAERLRQEAEDLVAEGKVVSLFLFSRTSLYHHVRFRREGYWEQRGGLFGKSTRSDPPFVLTGFDARLKHEINRVDIVRNFTN